MHRSSGAITRSPTPSGCIFSVNALLGTVCEKLMERGSLSREMTLDLTLANGATLTTAVRSGRATASRKTWLRLVRTLLERMVLPAGVVGLTLRAATVVTDVGQQGDLFDRGFATAAATEAALASLAEEQGDVVVVPENTAHPLVERRTKWVEQRETGDGKTGDGGERETARRERGNPGTRLTRGVLRSPGSPSPVSRLVPVSRFPFPSPVPGSRFLHAHALPASHSARGRGADGGAARPRAAHRLSRWRRVVWDSLGGRAGSRFRGAMGGSVRS